MKNRIFRWLALVFFPLVFSAPAFAVDCPELNEVANNPGKDATPALDSCFQRGRGSSVSLPRATFYLKQRLIVNGPITILGTLSGDEKKCVPTVDNCPVLRGANNEPFGGPGMVVFAGAGINVKNLIFDGDRENRRQTAAAKYCVEKSNIAGILVHTDHVEKSVFTGSVFKNALCGTGFGLNGRGVEVSNSVFYQNGLKTERMMWSDGLTVGEGAEIKVLGNLFLDNTDVQLIFGGCKNCLVKNNVILHGKDPSRGSFGGLMLHAWPNTSGNYQGTVVTDNKLECKFHCGYGIQIGANAWYKNTPTFGGKVTNNVVDGAMVGINIDDLSGPMEFAGNRVTRAGEGTFSCGKKKLPFSAVNIAAASRKKLSASSLKSLTATAANFPAKFFTSVDTSHCIANLDGSKLVRAVGNGSGDTPVPTNNAPPTPAPVQADACSASQLSPHWGMKDGSCRQSCGALGGTVAFSSACSNHGMADAGVAYDVKFCCKGSGANSRQGKTSCGPSQPAPHWGMKDGACRQSCGALGGKKAAAKPCGQYGLSSAGVAYDVKFCCK